jgi:methyl-accepting chemotaxis protein
MKKYIEIVKTLKTAFLLGFLAGVPLIIVFIFYTLPFMEEYIKSSKSQALMLSVDNAYSIIDSYYKKSKDGKLSKEKAKELAFDAVRAMRFGEDGYFFITNRSAVMQMHPVKPQLEGKDLINFKDPNGKALFKSFVDISNSIGHGYVDYMWPKKGQDKPQPKLSYITTHKEWGLIIGTGLYTDDLISLINSTRMKNLTALIAASLLMFTIFLYSAFNLYNKYILPVINVIGELEHTSHDVSNLAVKVNDAGKELTASGQDQSASIQETAATMDEITAMVNRNHDSAERSKVATSKSHQDAQLGKETMLKIISSVSEVETSYKEVTNQVEKSNSEISEITDVITQIGEKTQIINDIVFQTKLLSFNASVEAARAGEHGKGFAVVAEEIGNLASMSGNAAQEIGDMLEESTQQVKQIVETTNNNVKEIISTGKIVLDKTIDYAHSGEQSMAKILSNATTIDEMVNSIVDASKEQSQGVGEVSKAIIELNKTTAQNADLAKFSQDSATKLDEGSRNLVEVIFKLKKIA